MDRMYSPWRETYMQSFKDDRKTDSSGKSVFQTFLPKRMKNAICCTGGKSVSSS